MKVNLKIENDYADGYSETTYEYRQEVPPPASGEDLDDWAASHLFPFTGVGRSGDAIYEVTVTGADDPYLTGKVFTFGG